MQHHAGSCDKNFFTKIGMSLLIVHHVNRAALKLDCVMPVLAPGVKLKLRPIQSLVFVKPTYPYPRRDHFLLHELVSQKRRCPATREDRVDRVHSRSPLTAARRSASCTCARARRPGNSVSPSRASCCTSC